MSKRIVLLQALAATPPAVARLVAPLAPRAAREYHDEDGRTVAGIVAQMVTAETWFLAQFVRAVTEAEPSLDAATGEEPCGEMAIPWPESVEEFRQRRGQTIVYLKELSATAWRRRAVHPSAGRVPLDALVRLLVERDAIQLHELQRIRQRAQADRGRARKRRQAATGRGS